MTLQSDFDQQMYNGVRDAAAQYGVELLINDPHYDASRQTAAMEDFVQRKVDAIILAACDPVGIVPAVKEAVGKGIPVIAIDAHVKSEALEAFIGTANYEAGLEIGEWTADHIVENMNGKANIGVVSAFNSVVQLDRQKGFLDRVTQIPGVKVLSIVDGKNVHEEALAAAETLLTANPGLDLVYATGEPAVLGTLAAVKSQGAAHRVKIVGWDMTPETAAAIVDGIILAMIQQNPYREGFLAVELMLQVLREGKELESTIAVPVTIYTEENVHEFTK